MSRANGQQGRRKKRRRRLRSGSLLAAASSEGEEWSKALVLLSLGGSWPGCSPCPAVAGVSSVPLGLTRGDVGAFCSGLEGNPHPDALLRMS